MYRTALKNGLLAGILLTTVNLAHAADTLWLTPSEASASQDIVAFDKNRVAIAAVEQPEPWLRFDNLTLPKKAELSVSFARTSANADYIDAMTLEVREENSEGPLVGFIDLHNTGSWNEYQSRSIPLRPTQSASALFFKLQGNGGVNIESFRVDDLRSREIKQVHADPALGACMNLGGSLEAPSSTAPHYWGLQIDSSDLATIAAVGFDSVRLPVRWSDYAANKAPYLIDPKLFEKIDTILGWAFEYELKVILDVHHYVELNAQPDRHMDRFFALWTQISARYKDVPNDQLIFEILNEPFNAGEDGTGMSIARTDDINKEILKLIRRSNPERWVVLATGAYGGVDGLRMATPPRDDKIILSLHYYSPFDFTHQGAEFIEEVPAFGTIWGSTEDKTRVDRDFDIVDYWQKQWGYPVFLGEFGVIKNANTDGRGEDKWVSSEVRSDWLRYVRKAAESRNYGWCVWDYATTFAIYDKQGELWDQHLLNALFD